MRELFRMSRRPLPVHRFDTRELPSAHQSDAYRAVMSPMYDVAPSAGEDGTGFTAWIKACQIGSILVGEQRLDAQRLERSARRVRLDGWDHYAIMLMTEGGGGGEAGENPFRFRPGRACFFDLAQSAQTVTTATSTITLGVPRDVLDRVAPGAGGHHGQVLDGVAGEMLATFMRMLAQNLATITEAEAPHLANAARDLIAACVATSPEATERVRRPMELALLARIRRYIDQHLGDNDLSAERICSALGLSRSTLYRLFVPYEGVLNFIQNRRLARIRALLCGEAEHRSISELALVHGFASESHFSRKFRERFGCRPSDVRKGVWPERLSRDETVFDSAKIYGDWTVSYDR
jgi:AraC-like DNA-binding protein